MKGLEKSLTRHETSWKGRNNKTVRVWSEKRSRFESLALASVQVQEGERSGVCLRLWGFTRVSVQTALERVVKWTREKERVLVKGHTWRVEKSPYEEKYSLVLLLEAAVLFEVLSPKTRPQQWDR